MVIDFPFSLLNFLNLDFILEYIYTRIGVAWIAKLLYPTSIIHGVIGSLWWFVLPRLITSKRLGGIW